MISDSEKLDFSEKSSYSFKEMTSTTKELKYTVKVRFGTDEEYYTYAAISVDASKDKTNEISKSNDYKKYVSSTSSQSSSSSNSSENSDSSSIQE